jgi:hypothetical protein
VAAIRAYVPEFAGSEDAKTELGASGDLAGDDLRVYGRELFDAECLAATRLAQLLGQDTPLFKADELEAAMAKADAAHVIVLEADQRRTIATALTSQVSIISGGPGVGKTTGVRVLVELLETAWGALRFCSRPPARPPSAWPKPPCATVTPFTASCSASIGSGYRPNRNPVVLKSSCTYRPKPSSSMRPRWSTCRSWPGCWAPSAHKRG